MFLEFFFSTGSWQMQVYGGTPPCATGDNSDNGDDPPRTPVVRALARPCAPHSATVIDSSDALAFRRLMHDDEYWGEVRSVFVVSHGGFIRELARLHGLGGVERHRNLFVVKLSAMGRDFYMVRHCTKVGQGEAWGWLTEDPPCATPVDEAESICGESALRSWVTEWVRDRPGGPTSVYSSCLTRAAETAEVLLRILQGMGVDLVPDEVRVVPYVREKTNWLGPLDRANVCSMQRVNQILAESNRKCAGLFVTEGHDFIRFGISSFRRAKLAHFMRAMLTHPTLQRRASKALFVNLDHVGLVDGDVEFCFQMYDQTRLCKGVDSVEYPVCQWIKREPTPDALRAVYGSMQCTPLAEYPQLKVMPCTRGKSDEKIFYQGARDLKHYAHLLATGQVDAGVHSAMFEHIAQWKKGFRNHNFDIAVLHFKT